MDHGAINEHYGPVAGKIRQRANFARIAELAVSL
jgi:hypothetical protein